MAKKDLTKLSDEELIEAQIEASNRRDEAISKIKDEGLEIQAELDRRRLVTQFGRLGPGERETLRELLSEDEKNG